MAELPTYTASGQTRGGPTGGQVSLNDATRPYSALSDLGRSVEGAGQQMAAIGLQIAKENDLTWATEATSQFKREMIEKEKANADAPSETFGNEFLDHFDKRLTEFEKQAPSAKAAQLFRRTMQPQVDSGYESALRVSQVTRISNAEAANQKSIIELMDAYRTTVSLDGPDGAARDISPLVNFQIASIQERFGQVAPKLAEKMVLDVVRNVVAGTADTNPEYAKQFVNSIGIEPVYKKQLLAEIKRAEDLSTDRAVFNIEKGIEGQINQGYNLLKPVPMPSKEVLELFPPNKAQAIQYEVNVANGTIEEYSKIKGWNWKEQQKVVSEYSPGLDPVKQEVRQKLGLLISKSEKQQTEDPVSWQMANDPEIADMARRVSNLPESEQGNASEQMMLRVIDLQGVPPLMLKPEEMKRYLGLPTGLKNALSKSEASRRALDFNNSPPNQLTQKVKAFNDSYTNPLLRGMAWQDMQNLPETSERLNMGVRVATAIADETVRNDFLSAMQAPSTKTEETKAKFQEAVTRNDAFKNFVAGWRGDGTQRGPEVNEFNDSVVKYSMYLASVKDMDPTKAAQTAIDRIIKANYGNLVINGSNIPVYRLDSKGVSRSDEDMQFIQAGLTSILNNLGLDAIDVEREKFPLASMMPQDADKRNAYIQKAVRQTGTVAIEPDGDNVTIYLRGQGQDDFPFQLQSKQGGPFKIQLDTAKAIGQDLSALDRRIEELTRTNVRNQNVPEIMRLREIQKQESINRLQNRYQ